MKTRNPVVHMCIECGEVFDNDLGSGVCIDCELDAETEDLDAETDDLDDYSGEEINNDDYFLDDLEDGE